MDHYPDATGEPAAAAREWGLRASIGVPVNVQGRLWGVMYAASISNEPLPADTEARLANFTELLATAIANAQAREELRAIADEQAALRRVATLVARAAPPEEVFAAVTEEVHGLLDTDVTAMSRYDPDGRVTVVGVRASIDVPPLRVNDQSRLGNRTVRTLVFQTGRPARINDLGDDAGPLAVAGVRSAVGVPISIEGRLWGVISVASGHGKLVPAEYWGAAGRVHRAGRHRDRQRSGSGRAHGLPGAGYRRRRPGAPAYRARSARRRAAAAGLARAAAAPGAGGGTARTHRPQHRTGSRRHRREQRA